MNYSRFGQKFYRRSGITLLMDDLNDGLRTAGAIMLGGGNPANIPEMEKYFANTCRSLLEDGSLCQAICNYDGPQGQNVFIQSLADLLQREYGWPVSAANITLTNGSQSSFFYLFNILAGRQADGSHKKILLPLAPEYIGYADVGIDDDIFVSCPPKIELLPDQLFKYHIDFDQLEKRYFASGEAAAIAAICVSRPTNPSGNVLTDEEIRWLDALAQKQQIPLIIDNAYGTPFPNIIFTGAQPFWNDNIVLCMSLSKLGLPGIRCGIVIASEELTQVLINMNGIISLAPGSFGPSLGHSLIQRGDLLRLSHEVVRPFYREKSLLALDIVRQHIGTVRIHKPEGAMFLWLWFQGLRISTMELYHRLKKRGVLVVPGRFFFPGQDSAGDQCLRLSYVQNSDLIRQGIQIIAEEVERA